ncbi:MAG: ABC transporter permease [Dethiobacter sp.]|jgi:peptide/nickel transport system permease protein|nr:ABC transporter permease [Dethiobacter sp.]MBS3897906.1 ABC transporter permease [Dethiobacter sp.]MBS3982170.1 ABC transporter permease [Dethiobacter sp.]MCL4463033.1 ABC transporter permease [Bacillota bacterium]MCL5993403.1 ABC transporter permease [Bacillota bacterium]
MVRRQGVELYLGISLIIFLTVFAVLSPLFANYDPHQTDAERWLQSPGKEHFFGTDRLGRDIYSRVVYGARVSLAVGILAMLLSITVGTALGALAGYFGGFADQLIMRLTDIVLVYPTMLLALTLVAIFEPAIWLVVLVIGGTGWPAVARLVRGEIMRLKNLEFAAAARMLGASHRRVLLVHLLPNALGQIVVAATVAVPAAIMTEAGLGYFGLGIQPPIPTWGNMLREAQNYIRHAWWYATFPGAAIFLTVFAFHLTGEGLRQRLDPKSQSGRERRAYDH